MSNKKTIIIANWKMYLTYAETVELAGKLSEHSFLNNKIILCPSFTAIAAVDGILRATDIELGAQDVFYEDKGAYTGEISPPQLKELGVKYVIAGHSERRQYQGETDQMVNKKMRNILEEELIPILCVGETFEQRQEQQKDSVILRQVEHAFAEIDLKPKEKVIIAYEPVWVIGSGQAVDPEEAEHTNSVIKQAIVDMYPSEIQKNFSYIYGGSVNARNAKGFLKMENVDGLLVGGASTKEDDFISLIQVAT